MTILLLLFVSAANSEIITQPQSYNGTPTFNAPLTFNQFDDNGGAFALNSIQVVLTLDINNGQFILDNDGLEPASGNWEFGAKAAISSLDVELLNTVSAKAINTGTFDLTANTGEGDTEFNYDPSTPDGMQYIGEPASGIKSDFVDSASWAVGTGFFGTGTYDINLDVLPWFDFSDADIGNFSNPVSVDGSVTIIYDYAVPEPATMALLGLGLAFLRKKKIA